MVPAGTGDDERDERVAESRIGAIREADSLDELAAAFGTDSVHDAYFLAKDAWANAVGETQTEPPATDGLPGTRVVVDGHAFHVHGVTHAGTRAEEAFLRKHVDRFLERDVVVYCEQGIRGLYFDGFPSVCEMDDYRWAIRQCADLDVDSPLDILPERAVDAMSDNAGAVASAFREATFSLIESGGDVYGERFERALGDVAAGFLTTPADVARGTSYEAFRLSRAASEDPARLGDLQRYYERTFLPQPLEREWLRRHDPALELVSHARNERMADYAVYHNEDAEEVHLIVGAAHQPGVVYYLDAYRGGREVPEPFELF